MQDTRLLHATVASVPALAFAFVEQKPIGLLSIKRESLFDSQNLLLIEFSGLK